MGKISKYIPDKQIVGTLESYADQIKIDMKMIAKSAAADFYSDYDPKNYKRTHSFDNQLADNLYMHCKEKKYPSGAIQLIFSFDASEVSVSYGNPNWAFDADFIHGFHGGPHNIGNRTYSWTPVPSMSPSPWDIIERYVNRKYK